MKVDLKQKGFSLIELMVALVIGLMIIAGVLQVFVGSTITYSMQSGLSKIQENGRFAMSFLTRDLRQAGYTGCTSNSTFANTIRDASNAVPSFVDITELVGGQDDVVGTGVQGDPLAGTDVIEVRFADVGGGCDIDSHNPNAASIRCEANHTFKKGDVLVVTDCSHTAVFQQSNTNNNNTVSVIVHNTGSGTDNCTKGLGTPVVCTTNGTAYQFNNGSVMRMSAYRFYVATNSLGEPALYRDSIATGTTASTPSELVEGIEDMQILYGEDTSGDGTANYYVPLDEVSDIDDVISIRVSLLVRSIEDNLVKSTQTISYNGSTVPFSDGHLRKVFTSTIALRNRL